jgi:hypothetical protein
MYLAKELTQKSLPEIGELFGGRDHTTVLHAVRKIAWTAPKTRMQPRAARAGTNVEGLSAARARLAQNVLYPYYLGERRSWSAGAPLQ